MSQELVHTATGSSDAFFLERTPFGNLVLTNAQGERFEGVVPVRAFPIHAPEEGVSLVDVDGHEVAWIADLGALDASTQEVLCQELTRREFMPVLQRIEAVSSFSTPCTWTVLTDRGQCEFVLRGDEDIRRIGTAHGLLISDAHGIHYLVPDQFALDTHSKKILDRFL